jgi:RNA recognition motif-containing protein
MENKEEAHEAINGMNGRELKGRSLIVNEARPRTDDRRGKKRRGGPRRF